MSVFISMMMTITISKLLAMRISMIMSRYITMTSSISDVDDYVNDGDRDAFNDIGGKDIDDYVKYDNQYEFNYGCYVDPDHNGFNSTVVDEAHVEVRVAGHGEFDDFRDADLNLDFND